MVNITLSALVLASIFALISDQIVSPQRSARLFFLMGIILICVAGFRDGQNMPDYLTYLGLYKRETAGYFSYFIEVSFHYIVKLSNLIDKGNPLIFFLIYALLGVTLKLFSIKNLSSPDLYFYSLVIYVSNYFILHEMIQIRAGVATAIILLSIVPLYKREFRQFLILIGLATLFHYSSIIFLFLWFLKPNKYNKIWYIGLIPIAYLIHFSSIHMSTFLENLTPFRIINLKMATYVNKARAIRLATNIFGMFIFTRMVILIYFTYFAKQIKQHNKYIYILLKCYAIGIFIYIALSQFPNIAVRISRTLMVSEIIIIPNLIYTIKGRKLPRLIIIFYGLLVFYLNVYFTTFFSWRP